MEHPNKEPGGRPEVPAFIGRLLNNGPVSFFRYIEACLYDPKDGYYRRSRRRVGQDPDTDFFTSTTHRRLFGPLILEAARSLTGLRSADWQTVIEVATEPEGGLFEDSADFDYRAIPLGQSLSLKGGPLLVVANEWLDAQPFHRLEFFENRWWELGVALGADGLTEIRLHGFSPEVEPYRRELPDSAPSGYRIDLPTGATEVLDQLLQGTWSGLFLCFDYGTSWTALGRDFPAGTARTYQHHRQGSDLFETPGERDITCHLCWDHLIRRMEAHRFKELKVERQEAFLMQHAGALIAQWMQSSEFAGMRGPLRELLHPAYLGAAFQVLIGQRFPGGVAAPEKSVPTGP